MVITWEPFFFKNHSQNVVEKLFPDPFLKNQNWTYLWINNLKLDKVFFIICQLGAILIRNCKQLALISYKAFLKKRKRSGTSLPASSSAWFLKKNIFLVSPINWWDFIVWLPLIREIFGNICIVIVFNQVVMSWNLKLNPYLSNQAVFSLWPKSQDQKFEYLEDEKSFKMK